MTINSLAVKDLRNGIGCMQLLLWEDNKGLGMLMAVKGAKSRYLLMPMVGRMIDENFDVVVLPEKSGLKQRVVDNGYRVSSLLVFPSKK